MFPESFFNYNYIILDQPFISSEGINYPQTAVISFFNEFNQEFSTRKLGVLKIEHIYQNIFEKKACIFNEALIINFSLKDYRKQFNLLQEQPVTLDNFSVKSSVFISDLVNDFNYAVFSNQPANFEKTLFLKGSVSFANCIFEEGDPNFNSAIFYDGNVSFYNTNFVKGTKNIKNTRWGKGFKNFQYSFWGNGEALFANSIFDDGDIWFVNTTFAEGELSFKIAQLGIGKLYFKFSIFENTRMNFERIEYKNGIIDFSKTEINKGKINFNKSTFNIATIDFSESEINNVKFTFKNVYFKEGLFSFEDSILKETSLVLNKSIFKDVLLLFRNAHINELSLNACQINNYCDLRLKYCNNLDLSEVFLKDIVDISNEKYPTAIKSLNVFGTRLTGKMFISWSKNNVYPLIQNSTTHNKQKAWQYNLLKQNFSIIRQYNDEDMAYVAFKREELKAKQQQIKTLPTIKKIITWLSIYFEKIVFDKMRLYATSPVRVFTSVLVLWFVFGLIFILFDWLRIGKTWSSVGNHDQISVIAQSFYHSAITFFTIGYGEVFPQGASRIISAIEGFFGVFMMSYFTVAFVRKILR